ncbi:hypothetical protein [Clostridium sp. Marseille-QA1073]
MDKTFFRLTEKKLYNFFNRDKKIGSIKQKIELLNKKLENIEKKFREINIFIPEESRSINYEERVQNSNDESSYAERTAIKITENLERSG